MDLLSECKRHLIISADAHAGADVQSYRAYLAAWGVDASFVFPHAEGCNDPLRTYENMAHARGTPIEESLYGGNAAEILGLGT